VGLLQISFSKMFDDIFNWILMLVVILFGFSISFSLFKDILHNMPDDYRAACEGSVFETMSLNLGMSLMEATWIMFTGPDTDDVRAIYSCFSFDWLVHVMTYAIVAVFSLMIIIVLVNLLIAMMSKSFNDVCDDQVRETEWTFHMMNLKTKFVRRDFVAPVPVNLAQILS
jgi:hypothetical protein